MKQCSIWDRLRLLGRPVQGRASIPRDAHTPGTLIGFCGWYPLASFLSCVSVRFPYLDGDVPIIRFSASQRRFSEAGMSFESWVSVLLCWDHQSKVFLQSSVWLMPPFDQFKSWIWDASNNSTSANFPKVDDASLIDQNDLCLPSSRYSGDVCLWFSSETSLTPGLVPTI